MAFQLKAAGQDDRSSLADFLGESPFIHRHLDWQTAIDWLGSRPYWLVVEGSKIQAAMACPDDPEGVAWIRLLAARNLEHLQEYWVEMLERSRMEYETRTGIMYAAIALHPWFEELLLKSGFQQRQEIVVLEWTDTREPGLAAPQGIKIRPIEKMDLASVAEVDQAAFDLLWQNSKRSLSLSLNQAAYATVAEMDGEIIGYQICTSFHYSAHLARLAVLPRLQGNAIGKWLVADLLHHFQRQNISRVSVNTQSDNKRSLMLYQRMGFEPTGDSFNVFVLT